MPPAVRSWIVRLHRWIGLPAGIGLFILFASGSLATFSLEIQQWMQPQSALSAPETVEGLTHAGLLLTDAQHAHRTAFLRIPFARDPVFRLWQYDGHVFHGPALHPSTGVPLPMRDVVGGSFFVTLHECFYMHNFWGRLLVAIAGVGLILALITGVTLQYRRFFSDLLLFRPNAAPHRWWLDLHLLVGTLSFPVVMIIGLSGVILQIQSLSRPHAHAHVQNSSHSSVSDRTSQRSPAKLSVLEQQGKHLWKETKGGFFMPNGEETYLYHPDHTSFCLTRLRISAAHPLPPATASCPSLRSILSGIHNMRWAGVTLRWLYFLVGISGALMMASGLVLFYRTEQRHLKHTQHRSSFTLRLIYSTNTACIIGFPLACLGLLWSTRLPEWPSIASLPWETGIFFSLWGGSLLHALFVPQAARLQLLVLTLLGIGLLPLDWLTRPWMTARPWLFLSVDGCALLVGLTSLMGYRRLQSS